MPVVIEPTPTQWDTFVQGQPRVHTLQRANWGKLKSAFGWQVVRIGLRDDDHLVAGAQILIRDLPLGVGKMGYLPMGPYAGSDEALSMLWEAIDERMKREGAAFLKWEPGIFEGGSPDIERWGFRESKQTIQPPNTILIDISEEDDEILSRMSQSTRRKVRLGYKRGVTFYQGTRDDVRTFTDMIQTTGSRNEFGVHDPAYYRMAYDLFVPEDAAALILAEHEGDPLAGLMVFGEGRNAWYLYGASTSIKRNLMATYGIQWEAIQWAKAHGMHTYDMWGIPDENEEKLEDEFRDRRDGLWGVYGFKRGWGGEVMRSVGAWDKIYNPIIYTAYWTATQLRDQG